MSENELGTALKKVPLNYLWEGLILPDNIYNYNGTVLLVPNGETLSKEKLEHLRQFEGENGYITTREASYRIIFEGKSSPRVKQQIQEDRVGYTALKKDVAHILDMARQTSCSDRFMTEMAAQCLLRRLGETDVLQIFRCIDTPREMDEALQRHSLNVAFLNAMMGQWLELSEEQIKKLICVGLVHDIGKTKINEKILYAPRELTDQEFAVLKQHPIFSEELLWKDADEEIRQAVRWHHERMNGNGYPDGVAGMEIPFLARLTAVTDVYDAMVSERSYKKAMIPFDVLDKMRKGECGELDRELTAAFIYYMSDKYKGASVELSDGSTGIVIYIPPSDLGHPVIKTWRGLRQTDDTWYCVSCLDES